MLLPHGRLLYPQPLNDFRGTASPCFCAIARVKMSPLQKKGQSIRAISS